MDHQHRTTEDSLGIGLYKNFGEQKINIMKTNMMEAFGESHIK